jgi:hypothetical protein
MADIPKIPSLIKPDCDHLLDASLELDPDYSVLKADLTKTRRAIEPDSSSVINSPKSTLTNDSINKSIISYIQSVKKTPISIYESKLSKIMQDYTELHIKKLHIDEIFCVHSIKSLEKLTTDSNLLRKNSINNQLQNLSLSENNTNYKYKIVIEIIELISALLIKWNLFKPNKYAYRDSALSKLQVFIDAKDLNKNCINFEIIWLCLATRKSPLKSIASSQLLQSSLILESQIDEAIKDLLSSGIIKSSNEHLVHDLYASQHYTKSLKYNKIFAILCKSKKYAQVAKTYLVLKELEIAYRHFEREIIARLFFLNK